MKATRGWYVFTQRSNGKSEVHGGPYKTKKEAMYAIYDGLTVARYHPYVELKMWSAAEITRRRSMLIMPQEES